MESNAEPTKIGAGAETTNSAENSHTQRENNTTSLPSPPSSVKAVEPDSSGNENGSLVGDVAGNEVPKDRSAVGPDGDVSADVINGEHTNGQPSNDPKQKGTNPQDEPIPSGEKRDIVIINDGSDDGSGSKGSLRSILNQIRRDTLYTESSEEEQPLQQRIKGAAKLAVQQMQYVRLMEDRMKSMEKRLRVIENKGVEPEPPVPLSGEPNRPTGLIMDIKRMTFQEYLPTDTKSTNTVLDPFTTTGHKPRHEFPGQLPYHLIDVVVSGTNQPARLGKDQSTKATAGSPDPVAPTPTIPDQDSTTHDLPSVQPERIRINSTLLLRALEKITKTSFILSPYDIMLELRDQVILRPFKLFVLFEQEIRDEIDRLEKKHRRDSSEIAENDGPKPPTPTITEEDFDMPGDLSHEQSDGLEGDKSPNATEDDLESRQCLDELLVLKELLDKDLKRTFDLRKQIKDGSVRSIAFQDLWHLFSLGSEIVSNGSNGQSQTYRILRVFGGRPFLCNRYEAGMDPPEPMSSSGREVPKFEILSYFYDFDGKELGACQQLHTIKTYDGNKAITSLPCFPIIYSKHSRGLKPRDFFIERGKRFLELTRESEVVHKRYNGLTLAMDELREEVDSEVIIDVSMAVLKNNVTIAFGITQELQQDRRETVEFLDPRCSKTGCCQNTAIHEDYMVDEAHSTKLLENKGFMRAFIESDSELTEEDFLVLPCWVYSYVLRSRKWVKLEVSLVDDIKETGSGFDSLVLPDGHKETLLALVKTHSRGKKSEIGLKAESRQMDLVRGKGKGLIILLHGEPGVGKSSTAESVAEFTHRPLFQVTCGDIGESADEVERRLENHFQLAHKWGCVLLLDEADVFLEARSKTDLKRNAIVSVFLRVLEYYSGILFLTTNRVGAFDQAFRSRIHMSLFYPKIEEDATMRIWEMNIDRAREIWGDKLSIEEPDRKGILKFASKHYKELAESETTWNGRQIRNAFQTAIALAEWDAYQGQLKFKSPVPLKPRLESEHFERVAKASKHFDAYLKETQVGTMADLASNNRERRDDFRGIES